VCCLRPLVWLWHCSASQPTAHTVSTLHSAHCTLHSQTALCNVQARTHAHQQAASSQQQPVGPARETDRQRETTTTANFSSQLASSTSSNAAGSSLALASSFAASRRACAPLAQIRTPLPAGRPPWARVRHRRPGRPSLAPQLTCTLRPFAAAQASSPLAAGCGLARAGAPQVRHRPAGGRRASAGPLPDGLRLLVALLGAQGGRKVGCSGGAAGAKERRGQQKKREREKGCRGRESKAQASSAGAPFNCGPILSDLANCSPFIMHYSAD